VRLLALETGIAMATSLSRRRRDRPSATQTSPRWTVHTQDTRCPLRARAGLSVLLVFSFETVAGQNAFESPLPPPPRTCKEVVAKQTTSCCLGHSDVLASKLREVVECWHSASYWENTPNRATIERLTHNESNASKDMNRFDRQFEFEEVYEKKNGHREASRSQAWAQVLAGLPVHALRLSTQSSSTT
jgi:hypothetical protein